MRKRRDFERTGRAPSRERIEPQPRQRMFQQCHQLARCEALAHGVDDEIEERTRRRLRERASGAVVDLYAPGFEAHGDAACQKSIRRNERSRSAGVLAASRKIERYNFGFVLGCGRFDEAQSRGRPNLAARAAAAKACQRAVVPAGRMASDTNTERAA